MRPLRPLWRALIVLLACGAPAAAQDPPRPAGDPRAELRRFAETLDAAVREVSNPAPFQSFGTSGSRGYLLAGYGAVFVLPARALPVTGGVFVLTQRGGEPLVRLRRQQRLRETRPAAEAPSVAVEEQALAAGLDRDLEAIEAQAEAYQRAAERAARAAERALDQVTREIHVRLETQRSGAAIPAQPTAQPAEPASATLPVPAPPAPPPPAAAVPPEPPLPPPPPWSFWIQRQGAEDPRSADSLVADVRNAVTQVLEAHGPGLRLLPPEQMLVVAVDFTSGGFPMPLERAAGERTLVLRARKRDLDERRAGRLAADELRKRIEVAEY